MALVNQTLKLEITPGGVPPILHVTEYDENMQVEVHLLQRGQAFMIPSGVTAKVEGSYSGRYPFSENATPSGDTVTFMVSKNMTPCAGRAWVKIKLTKDSKPVHSCGFWMEADRHGVEAGDVIGAPGFQEQINEGVAEYFDNDPPFFELPSGGQSGQALLSDGADGAVWGEAGIPSAVKTALLACFQNVAWAVANGQEYYDALADALNDETPTPPPTPLPSGYQRIAYIANPGGSNTGAVIDTQAVFPLNFTAKLKLYASSAPSGNLSGVIAGYSGTGVNAKYFAICAVAPNASTIGAFSGTNRTFVELSNLYGNDVTYEIKVNGTSGTFTVTASNSYGRQSASGTLADTDYLGGIIRAFYYGSFQNQFIGRMASFELTNDDTNAVVTNLVACKRTSDGVGGMYDLQNSVFYSSNTTVAFVKGGDI